MRTEKKYLVEEVAQYLQQSDYLFLADYRGSKVPDFIQLRESLASLGAQLRVVKNSVLKHAAAAKAWPDFHEHLTGQTAIVVGGDSPSEVAKILIDFHKKNNEKCPIKMGIVSDKKISAEEVKELSKLPALPELRAQLLALIQTPARQIVRIIQVVPESILNVVEAQFKQK